jgi:hypothetical protein
MFALQIVGALAAEVHGSLTWTTMSTARNKDSEPSAKTWVTISKQIRARDAPNGGCTNGRRKGGTTLSS